MSARVAPKTEAVARCVARHDGGYLVVTAKGSSAISPQPIPEGAFVVIRDGVAERLNP
jgi:hypothetical protein